MRVIPTAELHGPSQRVVRQDVWKPEDSYAPFPTRADFEQAEVFVNNNCSDKLINSQLKLAHRHGMRLEVRTARQMHKLLALGVGEDTDDSHVRPVHLTLKYHTLTRPSSVPSGRDHGPIYPGKV